MATKQIRTKASAEGASTPAGVRWDRALDAGRQQMAVASESVATLARGFEAMRRIQEQAAREATQHHAAVAGKLVGRTPAELLLLQGELVRHDLEAVALCWQQLAAAALEMTTELCACSAKLVDTEDVLAATSPAFLHS
jgi:hypothetical protein